LQSAVVPVQPLHLAICCFLSGWGGQQTENQLDVSKTPINICIHKIYFQQAETDFIMKFTLLALTAVTASVSAFSPSSFTRVTPVTKSAMASSSTLSMKYTVAVVGGGPAGACAAEIFAQEKNIETVMFERKFDNAKPCGGAIPLCMVGEFDMPESVVDRKVCSNIVLQHVFPLFLVVFRSLRIHHADSLFVHDERDEARR
jgi:hypothetical protein